MDNTKNYDSKRIIILIVICIVLSRLLIVCGYYFWPDRTLSFNEMLCFGDVGWYAGIAVDFYNSEPIIECGEASYAFFPLFPLLVSIIHYTTGEVALDYCGFLGFFLNSVIIGLALFISYKYFLLTRDNKNSINFFVFYMTFGAYTIYYSMLYTEALFFLLLMCGLYCLEKKWYLRAGICGFFLGVTRLVGVFFVLAIILKYILEYFKDKKSIKGLVMSVLENENVILGCLIVPLGLALWMTYLNNIVGDPFAFIRVSFAWQREANVGNIFNALDAFVNFGSDLTLFYFSLWIIIGVYLVIASFKNKRFVEAVLSLCFLLTIILSGNLKSSGRYIVGGVVFVMTFIDKLSEMKEYSQIFAIAICCVLEVGCMIMLYDNNLLLF